MSSHLQFKYARDRNITANITLQQHQMWLQYSVKAFHGNDYMPDINKNEFQGTQNADVTWRTPDWQHALKNWCYNQSMNKVQQRSPHRMFQWQTNSMKYSSEGGNRCYNSAVVHNWFCFVSCVPAISMHPTHISQAPNKRTLHTNDYANSSLKSELNMNTKIAQWQ